MRQQIGQIAAAIDREHAGGGQPAQIDREEQDQQQPEPEGRDRNPDQHDEGQDLVGPAILPGGGPDADQQAEDGAQDQRCARQDQGCREPLQNLVEHRAVQGIGPTEIALEHVAEPDEILLP